MKEELTKILSTVKLKSGAVLVKGINRSEEGQLQFEYELDETLPQETKDQISKEFHEYIMSFLKLDKDGHK
jgi:hypothetical protein